VIEYCAEKKPAVELFSDRQPTGVFFRLRSGTCAFRRNSN
jgi:hypothetical protein